MKGRAEGYEVNIYEEDIEIKDIKSPDDLFSGVKDAIKSFEMGRISMPTDLTFEDEEFNEIPHEQEITSDLIIPSKETITIVHYFASKNSTYNFEYFDNENPIKTSGMNFERMVVIDDDLTDAFKKGDEILNLEFQGSGHAPTEETIVFWVDKNGKNRSSSIDHYVSEELSEEQEEELREFTNQLYKEIFN
jgi:hypothetical protein